jgi:hypothetical protein
MSALTDSVTSVTAEITAYDAAVAQLAAAQTALAQAQSNIETVRDNQTLTVTDRATQLVTLKSTAEVLQSDVNQQQLALTALQTQLTGDASSLMSQLKGELGGKIAAQTQVIAASIRTDYDVKQIMFPVEQIAMAHNSVLALKALGNGLNNYYRPGDTAYIDFARNAGAILTAIG